MTTWTDWRVETLTKMYTDGHTASQIAVAIGVSRGCISGKAFRLGLCAPRDAQWGKGKAKMINPPRKSRLEREAAAAEIRSLFAAVEIVDLPPEQSAVAVPFDKLSKKTCRWPLGDPRDLAALRFCGDRPFQDYPYCERHARIAYIPLARRGA